MTVHTPSDSLASETWHTVPGRPDRFRVIEATTEEACRSVFRLRYQILWKELGDGRHVDHGRGEYRDRADETGGRLFVAVDESGQTVGTIRGVHRHRTPFAGDDVYPFDVLTSRYPAYLDSRDDVGLLDRLCVAQEWRQRAPAELLGWAAARALFSDGARLILATSSPSNRPSVLYMYRMGFEPVCSWGMDIGGPWSAYVLRPEVAHRRLRSMEGGR